MDARVKVVLYGNTLMLAGLQASLATYPEVEVLHAADFPPDEQMLRALQPDVLIVDDAAVPPALLRQLSTLSPGLLLVSVDSARPRAVVWSVQPAPATSTRDLVEFIRQRSLSHGAQHSEP